MLTDNFINLICATSLSTNPLLTPSIASDCRSILEFYETHEDGIPTTMKTKFDLAKILSDLKARGEKKDDILENVRGCGKYKDLDSFIVTVSNSKKLDSDDNVKEAINQINKKIKITSSISNFGNLKSFIDDFESNSFDTIDQAFEKYESTVTDLYSKLSSIKRKDDTTAIRSLDLLDGDYDPVIKQIRENNSGKNIVSTGYSELDKYMNGGFQPGRLYIYSGSSNDGKSALLVNFIKNQMNRIPPQGKEDGEDIFLYITLENLIDESLIRLYSCSSNKESEAVTKNWHEEKKIIQKELKEKQEKSKTRIIMEFFPATTISVHDIMTLVEQAYDKYKNGQIKGIFIDYLDLIRSGQKFDLYRLELGQVAIDLKCLAVTMQVPVVTVTQLNRQGYNKEEEVSLAMMSESIKKVEHADHVSILRALETSEDYEKHLEEREGLLVVEIGKNRNGPKNKRVLLKTDFSKCLITDLDSQKILKVDEIGTMDDSPPLESAFDVGEDNSDNEESEFAAIL